MVNCNEKENGILLSLGSYCIEQSQECTGMILKVKEVSVFRGGIKKRVSLSRNSPNTILWIKNVEYSGLEPLTSTLPVSRSSQMS